MTKKLNCQQIISLLNFYLNNNLTPKLWDAVNEHLESCPSCKKKYSELEKILKKDFEIQNSKPEENNEPSFEHISQLSPYMDNELNLNENVRVKKMTISNTQARKELENLIKYQKLLQMSYLRTKTNLKTDYSKKILNKIDLTEEYSTKYFFRLSIIFLIILTGIIAGFIYLYF